MNLREILVLLISFFLAVTIILTFRKIINYRKNPLRKSKQSSISDDEVKVELESFLEENYLDNDIPPEPKSSSDDLIYLHIESDKSNSIQYKDLLNYFDSNDINLADEGGWLKIYFCLLYTSDAADE